MLAAWGAGDSSALVQLLPIVHDELRRLAGRMMRRERGGHTLQTTALVNEAYMRLVDGDEAKRWDSRGHFFAAAAEAMRRILVESARRKSRIRHGGGLVRVELEDADLAVVPDSQVLEIDEALEALAKDDPQAAELVKLRFFAGFSLAEAAQLVGLSRSSAYAHWAYARAWLRCRIEG